jgi:hypothetical protein
MYSELWKQQIELEFRYDDRQSRLRGPACSWFAEKFSGKSMQSKL